MYRLDRTAFKAHTSHEAAAMHASYYKNIGILERLRIAHYLNSIAFNFSINDSPKLDKTKFSVRSRNNG